jgi:hypothetical protein
MINRRLGHPTLFHYPHPIIDEHWHNMHCSGASECTPKPELHQGPNLNWPGSAWFAVGNRFEASLARRLE